MIALKPLKFFLANVTVIIAAGLEPTVPALAGSTNLPGDVAALIQRRVGCLEWSKKEHDPDRATQIKTILVTLKCSDIEHDEQELRQNYADNPSVIAALNADWVKVVIRVGSTTVTGTQPSDFDH